MLSTSKALKLYTSLSPPSTTNCSASMFKRKWTNVWCPGSYTKKCSIVSMSPCPVGIGSLTLQTNTLFMLAPLTGTKVSIYMVNCDSRSRRFNDFDKTLLAVLTSTKNDFKVHMCLNDKHLCLLECQMVYKKALCHMYSSKHVLC